MKCIVCKVEQTVENTYLRPNKKFRSYCKECWNAHNREYKRTSPVVKAYDRQRGTTAWQIKNFGVLREVILKRDGYKCLHCGMTQEQHIAKYRRQLAIDHIDRRGASKKVADKNNDPSNLQTLCSSCHGKKDNPKKLIPMSDLTNKEN